VAGYVLVNCILCGALSVLIVTATVSGQGHRRGLLAGPSEWDDAYSSEEEDRQAAAEAARSSSRRGGGRKATSGGGGGGGG
jgi:hypothetical protein